MATANPDIPPSSRPWRYLAFVRAAYAREAAYRLNVLIALIGFTTRVYVLHFVWTRLYLANAVETVNGIHLEHMLTYMVVGQLSMLVLQADSTGMIRQRVREGSIATDLMRPVSFPVYLLADNVGSSLLRGTLVVPATLFALLVVGIAPPPTGYHGAIFLVSLALGFLVSFLLNFLANATAFWTLETFGLQFALQFAGLILSGVVVPVWFLPEAMASVVHLLPFAAVYSTPLSIFIGRLEGPTLWGRVALQVAWVVALGAAAARVWRAAERRLVVQGG